MSQDFEPLSPDFRYAEQRVSVPLGRITDRALAPMTSSLPPQKPPARSSITPSFDFKVETEEEILDKLLSAQSKSPLDEAIWAELHEAAVRAERTSELAFAYESVAQGRKLKTLPVAVQAELFYRAARLFEEVLGDEFGATRYLERALAVSPGHTGAFERIDKQLTRTEDHKKLADLCVAAAGQRPREEQVALLKRAAALYDLAALEDKVIGCCQSLVRLEPADESLRDALEARYAKANRYRDIARMLEQALGAGTLVNAQRIRERLIDVFGNLLKEPERAIAHIEALLEADPSHPEARRIATRLLESKGLAGRAAAALSRGAATTEERVRYLEIELENTRGPKRREVLTRVGMLKQDELRDPHGALDAFEQALSIDPTDHDLRQRYVELGSELKGPLEVARTFTRVMALAKEAAVRARITAEMGALLLRGGDIKRARTMLGGVLSAPSADRSAVLVAARALVAVYEADKDDVKLADVLCRIRETSDHEPEREHATERAAEIFASLGDTDHAIALWRAIVDADAITLASGARERALLALEPIYEQREAWADLVFVLEQRARSLADRHTARALAFRAADVLTQKVKDSAKASEAWRAIADAYGASRDIFAKWIPILEGRRDWAALANALERDAELATAPEKAGIFARLGNVYLARIQNQTAAIDAFRRALDIDPKEKLSRATLEKLLGAGDRRLEAAAVLEPLYRGENEPTGLLRVLELKALLSTDVHTRLGALEEAAVVAFSLSRDKALEIVSRGLAEAAAGGEPTGPWLGRFDLFASDTEPKRRAALLAKGLANHPVTTPDLLVLATRTSQEHAAAGDLHAALEALRRALAYDPSSADILSRIDELLREQGNPKERVDLFREALEREQGPARRKQLLHSIGTIERAELGNRNAAIDAFKQAATEDPSDEVAHDALADLYTELERWEDLAHLLEAHLLHSGTPERAKRTRAHLVKIALEHGQLERAAHHARELLTEAELAAAELDRIEKAATSAEDSVLLCAVLERRVRDSADPQEQVQCLQRLAQLDRDAGANARTTEHLRQGTDIARGMGDDVRAIAMLEQLRELEPLDSGIASQLLELLERRGEFARMPALIRSLLELTPEPADRVSLLRKLSRISSEELGDTQTAFATTRDAFVLAWKGGSDRDLLADFEALAVRANAGPEFAKAIDEMVLAFGPATDAGTTLKRINDLTIAKARVLAENPATVAEAAAAYRSVLESVPASLPRGRDDIPGSTKGVQSERMPPRTAAAEGLEALLRKMDPSDARTAEIRWLYEWRLSRANPEEHAHVLSAWASVEERELADSARALALHKRISEENPEDFEALAAVARLSLALGDIDGALAALESRRSASEGEARNALDLQIASILVETPGRGKETLDRVVGVLDHAPHDPVALELAGRLLRDPEVGTRAAAVLEKSLEAEGDPVLQTEVLHRLLGSGELGSDARNRQYDLLIETLIKMGKETEAFQTVLRAAKEMPLREALWDRAEELARALSSPDPLAALYEEVLSAELPTDGAMALGQRAVLFNEEWFEDSSRIIRILERVLELDPHDTWAFDRLKLVFDAQERWDELFALYDRTAASSDSDRRAELLEEAAQIAKDFANRSERAIGYFEQLLEMKPGNPRLSGALERLYERHGFHRELIGVLGNRLGQLSHDEAQRERARIATLWLEELGDASSALIVIEDMIAQSPEGGAGTGSTAISAVDITELLERVLALAPAAIEIRESVPPPPEGRRDSYRPTASKRGLVRQRVAALLKERYAEPGHEADLARVLEVGLEAVKAPDQLVLRHQQLASIYAQLGDDDHAMDHFVELVLLEPHVAEHRAELAHLAARVGRFERLADVLVSAADTCDSDPLAVELRMHAGVVMAEQIGDRSRAIDLFFRVIQTPTATRSALLAACRHLEPLLEAAGRKSERLAVLERLAELETENDIRVKVLGETARLATSLHEDERAIQAWEKRLEIAPADPEALDGLVVLLEKAARWQSLIGVLEKRAGLDRPLPHKRSDRERVATILSEKLDAAEQAIATWHDIETTFGENTESASALARLLRDVGRFQELADLLARIGARCDDSTAKAEILRELGDVQREELHDVARALANYEAALGLDARNEGARAGVSSLLALAEHQTDAVRVLLKAYNDADDWRLILDITEHRLAAAADANAQIEVLLEASKIAEGRAHDSDAAFALVRRAMLIEPGNAAHGAIDELFRLAERTRSFRSLADALSEALALESRTGTTETAWSRDVRYRMGEVLEKRLNEQQAALDAYVHVAHEDPKSIDTARAVLRVAGRTMQWDAAARVIVETTSAREVLEPSLLDAAAEAASEANGWDGFASALAAREKDIAALSASLARDLQATVAVWHRDRRGDPDAAELAFGRALTYDPSNASLLAEIAQLQRRAKGRPLVDSLLRLSEATGGDLDLLSEAAEAAALSVGDRALSKAILDQLLQLAIDQWTNDAPRSGTRTPESYVDRATRELVKIYEDDRDYESIVALLVETSALPWGVDKARSLRHEAALVAVEKQSSADRGAEIYLGLIEDDPHDVDAIEHLVRLYVSGGRTSELLKLKRRLVLAANASAERLALRLEAAQLEDELGDMPSAIETLEENLSESPRHDATVSTLASFLARESRYRELEKLFARQAILAEEAGDTELAANLHARAAEVAETRVGDIASAIDHLRHVVHLEPRPSALDALARLSTSIRNHEAAARYLDSLRKLVPDSERTSVTLRLADAFVAAGKHGDARNRLEDEVGRDPEADDVRVRLASMYRANESWGLLAELLADGAAHAPDKATRLDRLREAADLHRTRTGEPERAIPLLEQAADLAPDEKEIKLALADALGAASRFDEARALLRTLVEAFGGRRPKERAPVHYFLARLDLKVGDRAQALVELDAATRIDPANPAILQTLAELARDDEQFERAERSYRALLTILRRQEQTAENAPISRSEVLFELSKIAHRQGEPDRAKEILESAFEVAQENIVESRRLENALRAVEDHTNLVRALESRIGTLAAPEEAAEICNELGRLYENHLGRSEDAFELRLRALDLDSEAVETHSAARRLATALGKTDIYSQRLRTLAETTKGSRPELAASLYGRLAAMAEEEPGGERKAAVLYEEALALSERDRNLLAALDRVYERLGDDAGQARVLGARVALDTDEGGASSDALYRLAQLRFKSNDIDAACDAFEQAFESDPDGDRAEVLLRSAAEAHPTSARIIDIYERIERVPGRERSLIDALVRRWKLREDDSDPMREAVTLAEKIDDRVLVEMLLRRYLEGAQSDNAGRVWALAKLSWISEESGNIREAVLLKREAAELGEPEEAHRLLYEVAGLASGPLGDLHLAATVYEELRERDPADRDAWELLLDVYRRTNSFDKMVALVKEVVAYVDDPAERSKLRLEAVKISMDKLRLSDADAAVELREIVDEDPGQVDGAILLVAILERNGREDELVELLGRQLDTAKDRQDGDAVGSLSRRLGQLLEARDRTQARDVYYAALDWDPNAKEVLVALEALHEKDGELEPKADIMERRLVLEHGETAERLALTLAELREGMGEADAALRALETGFRVASQSRTLRERLEAVYREQIEYGKLAELYVTDARGRHDAHSKSVRLREAAKLYSEELRNPVEATRVLREARDADPSNAELLGELVDALSAAGEPANAASELTNALESIEDAQERAKLLGRRAVLRARANDGSGAQSDFEAAIAAGLHDLRGPYAEHLATLAMQAAGRGEAPVWREYRLRIAQLRLDMGDIEDARSILTELLKTDSKDKATLRAIADLDERAGEWEAASATYRRLVGLEDEDGIVSAALKLLETCERAGRLADARGGLERARASAPNDVGLRQRLAWLYEQLGAIKELAELLLEEARAAGEVGPRFEGLVHAGQLLLGLSQDPASTQQVGVNAAVAPLEEAHALRPADLDCAALLSDAYVGGGRFDEAQELLRNTIGTFKGRRARELSALYHRLARVAEILGDRGLALQHLTTALDMDAQNGYVASELAYLAMDLGNLDLAQRALRAVTMLKTPAPLSKALAYQHLGEIANQQGDVKRAMLLLKRAIDDDPTLESARALLDTLHS